MTPRLGGDLSTRVWQPCIPRWRWAKPLRTWWGRTGSPGKDQDRFALRSHQLALAAWEEGRYQDHVLSVEVPQRRGDPIIVDRDEGPRPDTSLEALARLRPAFREGGSVTAGNSSTMNDGAGAVLLASGAACERLKL